MSDEQPGQRMSARAGNSRRQRRISSASIRAVTTRSLSPASAITWPCGLTTTLRPL